VLPTVLGCRIVGLKILVISGGDNNDDDQEQKGNNNDPGNSRYI